MPALQTTDFWRVNSYGYPNYFSSETKAQEAWATFESFVECHDRSYSGLKNHWSSGLASRKLDNHAVESWKATFEEFGLLYVISRSDQITITPAGFQFHQAALSNDQQKFVWIGLNLLFRYPLKGPPSPRRPKSAVQGRSDLLVYRFLYSAMRDLGNYFWWTELERIFCRVFSTEEARISVEATTEIRGTPSRLNSYPLPVIKKKGAFYNSLNQVANHAGMNHLVLLQDNESEHYGSTESRRRHLINRHMLSIVSTALGDNPGAACRASSLYVDRLPTAPIHADEQSYFDYLGAEVPNLGAVGDATSPQTIKLAGDTVFLLRCGNHYSDVEGLEKTIEGGTSSLCTIGRGQRVILSSDMEWTYLVTAKTLVGPDAVRLSLRRARPITNKDPIQQLLGEADE